MIPFPVVARELAAGSRRRATYAGRALTALAASIIAMGLVALVPAVTTTAQGKSIFEWLSSLVFGYCVLAGVGLTADCISSEKRDGTLGLLFLTDLKGHDIVLGKLVSSSISSAYAALAVVPVACIGLLLGGVGWREVFEVIAMLASAMLLSLAAGIFVSCFSRNERKAMFAAMLLMAYIVVGPFILVAALNTFWDLNAPELMSASPAFAFANLLHPFSGVVIIGSGGRIISRPFWTYPGITVLWMGAYIIVFLGIASRALPRLAHDRPKSARALRWGKKVEHWAYGKMRRRLAYRRRLLDRNPFFWLAARDRLKASFAWMVVGMLTVFWWWGFWKFPEVIWTPIFNGGMLFLGFGFFKMWLGSEICSRFMEDQQSGALELVLTTPLDVPKIIAGAARAMIRQFAAPSCYLLVALLLLLWLGQRNDPEFRQPGMTFAFGAMAAVFVADMAAIFWVALWSSVRSKRLGRALLGTHARILLAPWCFASGCFAARAWWAYVSSQQFEPKFSDWVLVWMTTSLAIDLIEGLRAGIEVRARFREFAGERFARVKRSFWPGWRRTAGVEQEPRGAGARHFFLRHWMASSIALALLLFAGGNLALRWRLRHQIKNQVKDLRRLGFPTDWREYLQSQPFVPAQQNAAAFLDTLAGQIGGIQWVDLGLVAQTSKLSKRDRVRIEANVTNNLPLLRSLPGLLKYDRFQAPALPPGALPSMFPNNYQEYFQFTPLVVSDSVLRLEKGDGAALAVNARILLKLSLLFGRSAAFDGGLWVPLENAETLVGLALNRGLLEDSQLAALQNDAAKLGAIDHGRDVFIRLQAQILEQSRYDPPVVPRAAFLGGSPRYAWKSARESQVLRFLRGTRELRQNWPGTLAAINRLAIQPEGRNSPDAASPGTQVLRDRLNAELRHLALARLTATAAALERYRNRFGHWPAALSALVPYFISANGTVILADPFDARALRYLPRKKGYLLYSVGPDQKDDGGVVARLGSPPGTDIVFERGVRGRNHSAARR